MQDTLNLFKYSVPSLVGALVILIIGYIVAVIVSNVVQRVVRGSSLDKRIGRLVVGQPRAETVDVAPWIRRAVFWLIMVFVLLAVFQALSLTLITQPLNGFLTLILAYIPLLIGAGILILTAWIIATILRAIVLGALTALRIDERLSGAGARASSPSPAPAGRPLARSLSEAVYWLVFLFFLPAILGALGLTGLLLPVQVLINEILGFLPKLIAAAVLVLVGWFVARLVKTIVSNLLAALGLDAFSQRVGLASALGNLRLSSLIGWVVYILILLPVIISALDALQLAAITAPASSMLALILLEIPKVFAAALTLVIAYVIGRVLSGIVTQLLSGMGFDVLLSRLGLRLTTSTSPSTIAGRVVLVAIMLFALIEAVNVLGFVILATLVTQFTLLAGHILMGLIIFAIGLFLAQWAARSIRASGTANAGTLATIAHGAILVLTGAMALREMGLAPEIITLAFTLVLGAIAVACAIAFGVGGRAVAGRELERWVESRRNSGPGNPQIG